MNRRLPRLLATVPLVVVLASCSATAKDTALTSQEPSLPTTIAPQGPSATELRTDSADGAVAAKSEAFNVAPPQGWKDETVKQSKTVLFLKDPKAVDRIFRSFSVIRTELKDRTPLTDLVEQGMIAQRQQGATAAKVADRRIGGVPAAGYRLTRTEQGKGDPVKIVQTQYYILRDKTVYITTLTSAEPDAKKATVAQDDIFGSWAWGPISEPSPTSGESGSGDAGEGSTESGTQPAPDATPSATD